MLAHSSIENVGIVVAGFGSGMVFVATNHPALAAIAFVAGLYHLINHSLYKTLLFFGVGAVETQTGTCDMDRLGGLIKWMPLTALGFLAGTLSIAALPPFNGFVSEWLTLQTMLRSAELSSTVNENRFCPVRRGTRAYGGAGSHLFCESVCDELFGNAPSGRKSTSDRSQIRCAGANGHSCRAVSGIRRAADLCNSSIGFGAKSIGRRRVPPTHWCRLSLPHTLRTTLCRLRSLVNSMTWVRKSDKAFCPDAGWWCCIAAVKRIPWCSPCPPLTCSWR